jgi:MazG family protein
LNDSIVYSIFNFTQEDSKLENNKFEIPKAKDVNNLAEQFIVLVDIIRILRKACPWDSKQTNESIAHLLIEECYETIDSIEKHDDEGFSKELGDILLHVIMHAIMAEERNVFNMLDVIKKIQMKLVYRHPHVFGDVSVSGADEVVQNWEALKMNEGRESILDGVPKTLPALLRAERIQHKASNVGFDWTDKRDVWAKVEEELDEVKEGILSGNSRDAANEIGDLIFAIVNAARFENVVPEEVLQRTNNKFSNRFQFIEKRAIQMNKSLNDMTLAEMDAIWDEAKKSEKENVENGNHF